MENTGVFFCISGVDIEIQIKYSIDMEENKKPPKTTNNLGDFRLCGKARLPSSPEGKFSSGLDSRGLASLLTTGMVKYFSYKGSPMTTL